MCVINETAFQLQMDKFYEEILHPFHHILLHCHSFFNSLLLYILYTRGSKDD